MVSVLILTKNEELNLPHCLDSLKWCDDIVVLDSFSSDRTVEIAESFGARIVQREFDNWAAHQNWANKNINFKHEWVYYSDADEIVPEDLRRELFEIAEDTSNDCVAFRIRYKNYFMGRWIRHCGIYPVWVLRFFQPSQVSWERLVNPTAKVDGREGKLKSHFLHFSFRKGLSSWFEKHNAYSTDEARESIKSIAANPVRWKDILQTKNVAKRRIALKELSMRLPFRAFLRFVYMYVIRLGFLDGLPGLYYCVLLSIYEFMIVLKIKETSHGREWNSSRNESA